MGAVLPQVEDGKEEGCCYASEAFSKSQTKYSETKRGLLVKVTFTRHFKDYLSGRNFKLVIHHRSVQWLLDFKDPDELSARTVEKFAAFDFEVQQRPGKNIDHTNGLSQILIVYQVTTPGNKENLHKAEKLMFFQLIHNNGNLFDSKDSLAHCISSDFKMSAENAESFKRRFPYSFRESTNSPLFVQ